MVEQTLKNMGNKNINTVRQGKYFEFDLKESDEKKAEKIVNEICEKLLANTVIEDYKIL